MNRAHLDYETVKKANCLINNGKIIRIYFSTRYFKILFESNRFPLLTLMNKLHLDHDTF